MSVCLCFEPSRLIELCRISSQRKGRVIPLYVVFVFINFETRVLLLYVNPFYLKEIFALRKIFTHNTARMYFTYLPHAFTIVS